MLQPDVAEQGVVATLVQEELAVVSRELVTRKGIKEGKDKPQAHIRLSMCIQVRRFIPRPVVIVKMQQRAFADIDKQAHRLATPVHDTVSSASNSIDRLLTSGHGCCIPQSP